MPNEQTPAPKDAAAGKPGPISGKSQMTDATPEGVQKRDENVGAPPEDVQGETPGKPSKGEVVVNIDASAGSEVTGAVSGKTFTVPVGVDVPVSKAVASALLSSDLPVKLVKGKL